MTQVLVQRACAKLRTAIGDEAVVRLNFTGDLRELLDKLEVIEPVLEQVETQLIFLDDHTAWLICSDVSTAWRLDVRDAAEAHFIFRDVSTEWVLDVRHAAYRIMDMVDELQDATAPAAATMTRILPRLAIKRNSMATKVNEINNELIRLQNHWDSVISKKLPDINEQHKRYMGGRVTVPCFEEASVVGRGADKERIVAVLLSAASNIKPGHPSCTILPIFGFPGSGKTTLAQMVFNDDTHSLQEYNFRVWVHVSFELDFHGIGQSILRQVVSGAEEKEEINNHGSISDVVGMEHVMKRLHELLNGKKVLLVLDDLWEENPIQLQLLKSMITFLGNKVHVIVTTCNQAIARKICTVEPYRLNPLGEDACWEIIKKFIQFEEEDEQLEKIGRKIARKCWGIPTAALGYARMLVDSRGHAEWEGIMKIINWANFYRSADFRFLMQTLFLCYTSMPPELRLCLDYYYGIFPNGHNIVKDDLVHQWIALDLIETSENSPTEIAEGYISRLLDMSFFQNARQDPASGIDDKGAAMFTMHDLVHGFASSWMSLIKTQSLPYVVVTNCRGKLDGQYDDDLRALRFDGCSEVEFNNDSFSRKRSLRVLELKDSSVQKLPDSIWRLRHLGYLKITKFSRLATLPESFGELTSLFHIDLSGCSKLINLPESFGKLIRLVHVSLSGCSGLSTLPESFENLVNLLHIDLSRCHGLVELPKQLQKLGKLVHLDLSFWSCFQGIGKGLGGLTNLEHLNLSNPCCYLAQQRSHLQELKDGLCKLTALGYLNLSMCLNPIFYYHKSQEESLQYIQSCVSGLSSLEHLDLSHNKFLFDLPESLGGLNRLHILDLSGCIRLKKVGAMKSLKFISLKNCRALESCNFVVCVDEDAAAYNSSNLVQLEQVNCKELQISCLEKVRYTEEAQRIKLAVKEKLEKLKLSWTLDSIRSAEDSALLGELTPPPNLQYLEINGYDSTRLPEYLGDLTSLQKLKIICCKQLNSLPDNIKKLTSLKDLCIFGCPELEKWCQLEKNKKMLAHIPNKNYGEHGSTSRPEIEEDGRSVNGVEVA